LSMLWNAAKAYTK